MNDAVGRDGRGFNDVKVFEATTNDFGAKRGEFIGGGVGTSETKDLWKLRIKKGQSENQLNDSNKLNVQCDLQR